MNTIHENLPALFLPLFSIFDGIIMGTIVVGSIFLLWRVFYVPQKKKVPITPSIQPFIPPVFHKAAAIKKLKALAKKEDWKNFSLQATQVFKKICEQTFQKPFAFATGKEMTEILKEKISVEEKRNIEEFFLLTDPIKFAKASGKNEIAKKVFVILESFS